MRLRTLLLATLFVFPALADAQPNMVPPYAASYTMADLGPLPAPIPVRYSGMCFFDANTILIAGDSNSLTSQIYRVTVIRDPLNHITGFAPAPTPYKNAPNIDGGPTFGPGGVLFCTTYSDNRMHQWKPGGGMNPDKTINLTPLGVTSSTGGVQFVPTGWPGAGGIRITSYSGDEFYIGTLTPDGLGTYNLSGVTMVAPMGNGPIDFIYTRPGSPVFNPAFQYILVSEFNSDQISAYQLNPLGYPILATRNKFMDVIGPTGACFDPWSGDYLFTTWNSTSSKVIRVFGGPAAPPPGPGPGPVSPPGPPPSGEGSYIGMRPNLPPTTRGPEGCFGFGGGMALPVPRLMGPFNSVIGQSSDFAVFNRSNDGTNGDSVGSSNSGDAAFMLMVAALAGASAVATLRFLRRHG